MSLTLNRPKTNPSVTVSFHGYFAKDVVHVYAHKTADLDIDLQDWLDATLYILANTNLEPNDSRLEFIRKVKSMKKINGWNGNKDGSQRLKVNRKSLKKDKLGVGFVF
jgi:hypothetical protein